jgi:hypothetical protein
VFHTPSNSIWNKEELPDQWKESIFVPVHKKDDKTDCSDYHGISLLSTSYRNVEYPGKRQFIDKTNGEQQCRFQNNRSTSVRIFCIHQVLEKKI